MIISKAIQQAVSESDMHRFDTGWVLSLPDPRAGHRRTDYYGGAVPYTLAREQLTEWRKERVLRLLGWGREDIESVGSFPGSGDLLHRVKQANSRLLGLGLDRQAHEYRRQARRAAASGDES